MRGEGRGKLDISRKIYTFGYEMSISDQQFVLGVDFPFYKEEFLKIHFGGEVIGVGGSLYRRMLKNFERGSRWRKESREALSSLGHLLASIRGCRGDPRGKSCFAERLNESWKLDDDIQKGRLRFSYFPYSGESHGVVFDNFKIQDGYFNRQKIDIRFPEGRIIMDFTIKSCSGG